MFKTKLLIFPHKNDLLGAGLVAGWLKFASSTAGGPVFRRFKSWGRTWHCSSNHAEAASHMPQLGGPTTKNIQLCTWVLWGKEKRKKKKSLKTKKKKRSLLKKKKVALTKLESTGTSQGASLRSITSFQFQLPSPKFSFEHFPQSFPTACWKFSHANFNVSLIIIYGTRVKHLT